VGPLFGEIQSLIRLTSEASKEYIADVWPAGILVVDRLADIILEGACLDPYNAISLAMVDVVDKVSYACQARGNVNGSVRDGMSTLPERAVI
jgi:hypothetical protein